jgi:hypothetical protein
VFVCSDAFVSGVLIASSNLRVPSCVFRVSAKVALVWKFFPFTRQWAGNDWGNRDSFRGYRYICPSLIEEQKN